MSFTYNKESDNKYYHILLLDRYIKCKCTFRSHPRVQRVQRSKVMKTDASLRVNRRGCRFHSLYPSPQKVFSCCRSTCQCLQQLGLSSGVEFTWLEGVEFVGLEGVEFAGLEGGELAGFKELLSRLAFVGQTEAN